MGVRGSGFEKPQIPNVCTKVPSLNSVFPETLRRTPGDEDVVPTPAYLPSHHYKRLVDFSCLSTLIKFLEHLFIYLKVRVAESGRE